MKRRTEAATFPSRLQCV